MSMPEKCRTSLRIEPVKLDQNESMGSVHFAG